MVLRFSSVSPPAVSVMASRWSISQAGMPRQTVSSSYVLLLLVSKTMVKTQCGHLAAVSPWSPLELKTA